MRIKQVRDLLVRKDFYVVILLAVFFGALTGAITILFEALMNFLQKLLWTTIPTSLSFEDNLYTVLVCVVGGLFVGLAVHFWGEYPESIEAALKKYKKTRAFDYHHIPQAFVIAVLSLSFGAALGPEAGLTAIIGGLATWIGLQLKKIINLSGIEYLTIGSVVGAIFHSPIGGAIIATEEPDKKQSGIEKTWLTIAGIIAGLVGFYVFRLGSSDNYFDLGVIDYSFRLIDLFWAIVPIAGGIIAGLCLALAGKYLARIFKPLRSRRYISAPIGGLGLGLLVVVSPLILFSGHEGIREIIINYPTMSAASLIGIGLLKTIAAALCLATGWKGGQFFPSMFAGAAVGMGVALLFPDIPVMIGLAAGLSATLGFLLKKPVAAIALAVFFFPPSLWPAVMLAAFIGALASKKLVASF